MSELLRERFAAGKAEGRPLFIGYLTAGYPTRADTVDALLGMEAGGADVLELGVPFSDPMADGATVQGANQVALEQGISLADCVQLVREARAAGLAAPVVLMGYYNPILSYGEARLARDAAAAGVDGFIVVDLPPEEATNFVANCRSHGLSFVPLVAPTTRDERIGILAGVADSFLYCVSVTGTTGKGNVVLDDLPEFIRRIRAQTTLPLAVGFGISTRANVEAVGKLADAAVVGSAIISAIASAAPERRAERVREFVEDVSGHKRAGGPGSAS
ncbi:MAG: tryptophan synthase subunit alpha [Dehalococcoidia bacterium]|nr:tryptophan synthase subunit alpha [Dehalococcoidia bacterium]